MIFLCAFSKEYEYGYDRNKCTARPLIFHIFRIGKILLGPGAHRLQARECVVWYGVSGDRNEPKRPRRARGHRTYFLLSVWIHDTHCGTKYSYTCMISAIESLALIDRSIDVLRMST